MTLWSADGIVRARLKCGAQTLLGEQMNDDSSLADMPTHLSLSTCTVDVETTATSVVVSVAGELDMADADQVRLVLAEAVQPGTPIGADERGVKFTTLQPARSGTASVGRDRADRGVDDRARADTAVELSARRVRCGRPR